MSNFDKHLQKVEKLLDQLKSGYQDPNAHQTCYNDIFVVEIPKLRAWLGIIKIDDETRTAAAKKIDDWERELTEILADEACVREARKMQRQNAAKGK